MKKNFLSLAALAIIGLTGCLQQQSANSIKGDRGEKGADAPVERMLPLVSGSANGSHLTIQGGAPAWTTPVEQPKKLVLRTSDGDLIATRIESNYYRQSNGDLISFFNANNSTPPLSMALGTTIPTVSASGFNGVPCRFTTPDCTGTCYSVPFNTQAISIPLNSVTVVYATGPYTGVAPAIASVHRYTGDALVNGLNFTSQTNVNLNTKTVGCNPTAVNNQSGYPLTDITSGYVLPDLTGATFQEE